MWESDTFDLAPGEYLITPAESMRSFGSAMDTAMDDLTSGRRGSNGFYEVDVEDAAGTTVARATEREVSEGLRRATSDAVHAELAFEPPDGEPFLSLGVDRSGFFDEFVAFDPRGRDRIARIENAALLFGTWKLSDRAGVVQATAERDGLLGKVFRSNSGTYEVPTPDGDVAGTLTMRKAGSGLVERALVETEVDCSGSSLAIELHLALALAITVAVTGGS